jgi:hypothetical protein
MSQQNTQLAEQQALIDQFLVQELLKKFELAKTDVLNRTNKLLTQFHTISNEQQDVRIAIEGIFPTIEELQLLAKVYNVHIEYAYIDNYSRPVYLVRKNITCNKDMLKRLYDENIAKLQQNIVELTEAKKRLDAPL